LRLNVLKTFKTIKEKYPDTKREEIEIISGHARGADSLGEQFAKEFKLNLKIFPANWEKYGRGAGPIRNEEMAKYAAEDQGILIAFKFPDSRGTASMIQIAKQYNLETYIFNFKK
jgi:hypothetical protein